MDGPYRYTAVSSHDPDFSSHYGATNLPPDSAREESGNNSADLKTPSDPSIGNYYQTSSFGHDLTISVDQNDQANAPFRFQPSPSLHAALTPITTGISITESHEAKNDVAFQEQKKNLTQAHQHCLLTESSLHEARAQLLKETEKLAAAAEKISSAKRNYNMTYEDIGHISPGLEIKDFISSCLSTALTASALAEMSATMKRQAVQLIKQLTDCEAQIAAAQDKYSTIKATVVEAKNHFETAKTTALNALRDESKIAQNIIRKASSPSKNLIPHWKHLEVQATKSMEATDRLYEELSRLTLPRQSNKEFLPTERTPLLG